MIVAHRDGHAAIPGQRVDIGGDGAVAVAFYGPLRAVHGDRGVDAAHAAAARLRHRRVADERDRRGALDIRSEEPTSELQSLMRISYAAFCLKKHTSTYNN